MGTGTVDSFPALLSLPSCTLERTGECPALDACCASMPGVRPCKPRGALNTGVQSQPLSACSMGEGLAHPRGVTCCPGGADCVCMCRTANDGASHVAEVAGSRRDERAGATELHGHRGRRSSGTGTAASVPSSLHAQTGRLRPPSSAGSPFCNHYRHLLPPPHLSRHQQLLLR